MGIALRIASSAGVCALVSLACGKTEPEAEPVSFAPDIAHVSHVSGSRLRARVVEANGVSVFQEWFDTELAVVCQLALAEDGTFRCLPAGRSAPKTLMGCDRLGIGDLHGRPLDEIGRCFAPELRNDSESFVTNDVRDAACEARACAVCETRRHVYQPGPFTADGECTGGRYVTAERVPPERFVAARFEDLERGPRLSVRYAVFDDGARSLFGLVDRVRNEECHPVGTFLGDRESPTVCAPMSAVAWITNEYATACEAGERLAYGDPCSPSSLAVVSPHNCEPADVRALAEQVPAASVFVKGGDACLPSTSEQRTFFKVGGPLPADTFARLVPRRMGSGRIVTRAWTEGTNPPLAHVGIGTFLLAPGSFGAALSDLEDSELGYCSTAARISGAMRCVPRSVPVHSGVFSDTACSIPVVVLSTASCGASKTPADPTMMVVRTSDCDGELRAVEAHHGAVFRRTDTGACEPFTTDDNERMFRATTILDGQKLASVTIRQE